MSDPLSAWDKYNPIKAKLWKTPQVVYIRSLATINLFVLAIRLVQIFFAGVILGIMAYYLNILHNDKTHIPSSFIFALVVPVFAILTQFIYCFRFEHHLYFLWDLAIGLGFLISFFWFHDTVSDQLSCGWGAFNPFGSDRCAQTRSVFVMEIILTVLWIATAAIQAFGIWRTKRQIRMAAAQGKEAIVV
ncbi:uncharacterized protein SAPINGB_P003149 [Magnusiomyces paraingens]|uniref:MARVEL domain-containing protein n=1 Tax=Magnusiomyces paraingens TaxID=2606893 RepID=A0A5E8BM73_9ASCO|nr:uncharacterized protein SAPINGB_P003149 [Saprochaete ingens]VVT51597.1 unnamed protein product [Saprochaete ingens]